MLSLGALREFAPNSGSDFYHSQVTTYRNFK
nr:MAG TPA: hypothetical protein [Bacteriophage sp.]